MEVRTEFFGNPRTDFMVGFEVEHTAMYGMKTLFVQGYKSADEIYNKTVDLEILHIYLGANRSFNVEYDWGILISQLLNLGFRVTLDYPIQYHNVIKLPDDVIASQRFVPLITVDIPNLKAYHNNLILKVDDPTAVNDGVWCFNCIELANTGKFTAWEEYAADITIKDLT